MKSKGRKWFIVYIFFFLGAKHFGKYAYQSSIWELEEYVLPPSLSFPICISTETAD